MEFDPIFQEPQHHLSYISRNHFLENPSFNPQTQTMFPSQSSILIPPSPPPITFHHPNNSFPHFQNPTFMMEGPSSSSPITTPLYGIPNPSNEGSFLQDFVNVHRHHPVTLSQKTNNMGFLNNRMINDALHGNRHKGKAIWDFSQKIMVHQSHEASSSESSPPRFSLSNEKGWVRVMSEYHWNFDQRMHQQQKMKKVTMKNNTNIDDEKIIKGQWTPEEDSTLVELVNQFGLKKWSQIAKSLPQRIGKQCRERWYNHLKPNIKKDSWTLEEDMILIKAHQEVGNKWSEIAKRLPGRPENTIKNHWNTAKRRRNCESHDKNEHSSYEGSMLYAYAKKVAAIEEATKVLKKSISKKKKKNKKVLRCNYDHFSHDVFNGNNAPTQVNNNNVFGGNFGYGVMEKGAMMKKQKNKKNAKY